MFSKSLEEVLRSGLDLARSMQHEYMTLEHLLSALVEDAQIKTVLKSCEVDRDKIKAELAKFFKDHLRGIKLTVKGDPSPTVAVQRVLQRAVLHVQAAGKTKVSSIDVLVALFSERESFAVHTLQSQGMNRYDTVLTISHGNPQQEIPTTDAPASPSKKSAGKDPLENWCVNLNKKALDNKIDPLIARSDEMERIIQILCRRTKNNPLLVGEAGVGKTAVVEGLARAITRGEVPAVMEKVTLYLVDMGALLAGTRYRGDFEERLKKLFNALAKDENAIAFIDEIHTIMGAGATGGGTMDASNLLKPMLAKGSLRCIGATTYKEFRNHLEKDRAFIRRFQRVDIEEPSRQNAVKIIAGLKKVYEDYHKVKFTQKALEDSVMLSAKYIGERRLPDKAIDIIDEAGARQALVAPSKRRKVIHEKDIEKIVAQMARIPSKNVSSKDAEHLKDLKSHLKRVIHGQDEAVEALVDAVKLSRVGLREGNKPVGCYLFTGPTGVGKTETARQLAMTMGISIVRFDMSEYMEKHSVSRLIGTPPGYVGFEQGGLLTEAIQKTPHSVLLLDEVEKAHKDVLNLLLQVMDYGRLTDNNGNTVDFSNVILIMTSNVGAVDMAKSAIGFGGEDGDLGEEAYKDAFSPEFRNRLDATIKFARLSPKIMEKIAQKALFILEAQLDHRHISLELSEPARKLLAKLGFSAEFGARPLERIVREKIKKPLAEEILFGKLKSGGTVIVDRVNNKPEFKFKIIAAETGSGGSARPKGFGVKPTASLPTKPSASAKPSGGSNKARKPKRAMAPTKS